MKLSIIIPVYNEAQTVPELMERVQELSMEKEVLVVDDGSEVQTKELLQQVVERYDLRLLTHKLNLGKGAAVRTALQHVTGEAVVVQDADLEYFPQDIALLVKAFQEQNMRAVYGVRNLSSRSSMMRWGNRLMTVTVNLLYGSKLHDIETCYKLIDSLLLQSLNLVSSGFEIEAEITAKLLQRGVAIHEVPIRYAHRKQGKKLTFWDGLPTLWTLLKLRFRRRM